MPLKFFSVSRSSLAFFDAIAGGGGLITVPSMFLLGVPPTVILGTNRFQAAEGELTSVLTYWRYQEIDRGVVARPSAGVAAGSLLGTLLAIVLCNNVLARIIPILMLLVLLYAL